MLQYFKGSGFVRRFIFYPIWKLNLIDSYLSEMESNGFRLTNVKYRYFFTFTNSAKKDVKYFTTVYFPHENISSMFLCEDMLVSNKFNANKVASSDCKEFYRITGEYRDIEKLNKMRKNIIHSLCVKRLVLWMFLFILFAIINALAIIYNHIPLAPECIFLLAILAFIVYYICGFVKTKK